MMLEFTVLVGLEQFTAPYAVRANADKGKGEGNCSASPGYYLSELRPRN